MNDYHLERLNKMPFLISQLIHLNIVINSYLIKQTYIQFYDLIQSRI